MDFPGFLFVVAVNAQTKPSNTDNDPSFGGVFSTPPPYIHPDEYNPPENKQDKFDMKLFQVSLIG